jgi:hypothetical protein
MAKSKSIKMKKETEEKPIPKAAATQTREVNTNPNAAQNLDGIGGMKIKPGKVIKDISEFGYAVAVGDHANFPGHVHQMLIEKGYITA